MASGGRGDAVTVVREVRIFRALTEPPELLRWWGRRGPLTDARVNLRPGGDYRLEFRDAGGETSWVKGQYQVVEPGRIVKTWFSSRHPDLRNSVELRLESAPGGGTRITVVHSGLVGRPEALREYEREWAETLELLETRDSRSSSGS